MTLLDKLAEFFRARPGLFIDAHELQDVGGRLAWRTRISELRRLKNMRIDNRLLRWPSGQKRSQYCYVPPPPVTRKEQQLDLLS
jgi:hypothetical protein